MDRDEDLAFRKQILDTQRAEMRSLKPNASVYRQMVNNSNVYYLTTREDIKQHLKQQEKKLLSEDKTS